MNPDQQLSDSTRIWTRYPEMDGRVAVVTGAGGGIGAAMSLDLVAQGVNVIGVDIDVDAVRRVAALAVERAPAPGASVGRIRVLRVDVTKREDHEMAAQLAVDEFGRLDYWLNNAGVFPESPVRALSEESFDRTMHINVNSVLLGAQAAAASMTNGGAIVNTSSSAATKAMRNRTSYSVSKAAVSMLTRNLAIELGDSGIRVNAIAPGYVDTTMTDWIKSTPEQLASALRMIPLGRFGSPYEIAAVALFLLSDSARFVNGTEIIADGGSRA